MNKIILFLVLFNALMFGSSLSCTPNEVYMKDCNTCVCSADGEHASCTMMGCHRSQTPITPTIEINLKTTTEDIFEHNTNSAASVNTNGNQVCTPNEIKMQVESNDICNRCKCAANGIGWFCTKIPCPARDVHKRTARSVARRGCRPGDILSDGCNHCVCDPSGVPSCVHLPCLEERRKRSPGNDQKCTPGESYKVDCNNCYCTETGIGLCTQMACLGVHYATKNQIPVVPPSSIRIVTMDEYNREDFECTPQEYFKLECNSCKCSSNGRAAKCTKKACV